MNTYDIFLRYKIFLYMIRYVSYDTHAYCMILRTINIPMFQIVTSNSDLHDNKQLQPNWTL